MISFESFVGVVTIWTVAVITPGPNFFITARSASSVSRVTAFFVVLGICTGTFIWGVCGFFGLAVLFMISPWFYLLIRMLGAVYLIWLGFTVLLKAARPGITVEKAGNAAAGFFSGWRSGLLTILSNPKSVIFVTSLFASVLPPGAPVNSGFIAALLMVVISFVWYSLVMLLFSSAAVVKKYQALQRWMDGLAGSVFIGFGIRLILDGGQL